MTQDSIEQVLAHEFAAARAGDRDAYTRMVGATQHMVNSVALAVTRDVTLSEEVAQDTYLNAWQRLGLLKDARSFLPWLRQIARHRAIDQVRSRQQQTRTTAPLDDLLTQLTAPDMDPASSLDDQRDAMILAHALDEVPEECREVLLLYYREGQSTRDVAALLSLSDAAVRKRLQRAREALREEVLRAVGTSALRTAPGMGFAMMINASLATRVEAASAATAGAGVLAKSGIKALLGALASVLAAIGVVLAAVFFEYRCYFKRVDKPDLRRALWHNGIVYGALMATYIVLLAWAVYAKWSLAEILGVAVGFSVAIVLLSLRRRSLMRQQQSREAVDPPRSDCNKT